MKEILVVIIMINQKKGLEGSIEFEEEQNEDVREITLLTSTIVIAVFRLIKVFDRLVKKENE